MEHELNTTFNRLDCWVSATRGVCQWYLFATSPALLVSTSKFYSIHPTKPVNAASLLYRHGIRRGYAAGSPRLHDAQSWTVTKVSSTDIQDANDRASRAAADFEADRLKGVPRGVSTCQLPESDALNEEGSLWSAITLLRRLAFKNWFDGPAITFYLMVAIDIGIAPLLYEQTLYQGTSQIDLVTYAVETQYVPDAKLDTGNQWFFYSVSIAVFIGYFLQAW